MENFSDKTPKIRFPEFKNDWEHKKLSHFLSEAKKRNTDLKYDKEDVLSVSGELGIINQIEHLGRSYAGVSVHQYHIVETGDIVYTKSPLKANPFGIIKLNKGKTGIVSTLYAVYKVNEKTACGEFLDYYFSLDANTNRYLRPLVKKGAKNDMKINNSYVLNDRVFAPSIEEQKRITDFFTIIDKKLSQLKQKKTLLEQYKKGVMQKIFSQVIRFRDENGQEFPKWEKKKFKQIYNFKVTNSFSRENLNYESGKVKNIHYGDIHTKFETLFDITKEEVPYINSDILIDKINHDNFCKKGDIVFADASEDVTDVGKSIELVNLNGEKVMAGLHTILARPDNSKMASGFGGYLMKSEDVRKQIMKISQGSKVTSISSTRLCNIELNIPCRAEQTRIADFLSAIDNKVTQTQTQIEKAELWKKGLLQKMFV